MCVCVHVHVCQACFLVMLADCSGENRARAAKASLRIHTQHVPTCPHV